MPKYIKLTASEKQKIQLDILTKFRGVEFGLKELLEELPFSHTSIRRIMAQLEENGIVTRVQDKRTGGRPSFRWEVTG